MAPEPPRLALRVLERALRGRSADERDAIIGDLVEDFHSRTARVGGRRARLRFWRETAAALVALRPSVRRVPHLAPGDSPVHAFLADLRHGARLLRRAPAFTTISTLTLGLGIGATTAVFSVVDPVLLRPLPYPEPERIVIVNERGPDGRPDGTGFATFADVARESRTLERVAVIGYWAPTLASGTGADGDVAELLAGDRVSWTYFRVLGVRPFLGRDFVAEDDSPANRNVVILSHGLWARRFARDSSIVGRSIRLDGIPVTVVGVMPASFDNVLSPDAQIWRVLGYSAELPWACRTCHHLRMLARLRPGVARETAAAELDQISARLVAQYPKDYSAPGMLVSPLQEDVTRSARPALLAVLGASALLLLIACANVVNLQLGRAVRRADEFAIRAALGAGRARLAQQLLAEGLLLALLGGAAGVLIARAALPALVARLPERLPRLSAIQLDVPVLLVAAATTLGLGLVIGLAPAWQSGRRALSGGLRGRGPVGGHGHRAARSGLVVAEVALALMLLVGAGLVGRSLVRLLSVDAGFDPRNLLTLQLQATGPRYEQDAAVYAYHDRVREAVRALPGVEGVGLASQLPLGGNTDRYGVRAQDKPLDNPQLAPSGDRYVVSADYMRTMRIPILAGRGFTDADAADSAAYVAIVSAELAERIWPGESALGKRVQMGEPTRPWRTVVGIAADVRHSGLDATERQQVYVPERQWSWADGQMALVVRTRGDPAASAAAVRRVISSLDPTQPIAHVATMDEVIATSTAQRQLALTLFAAFGIAAVLLATFGIYGVLAGNVAERTREIGLRSALGATPADIIRMILRQGATLAVLGVALGLVGALALTRFLRTLLFGVGATDPATLVGVAVVLGAVALAACVVPARRAVRVDPLTALRAE